MPRLHCRTLGEPAHTAIRHSQLYNRSIAAKLKKNMAMIIGEVIGWFHYTAMEAAQHRTRASQLGPVSRRARSRVSSKSAAGMQTGMSPKLAAARVEMSPPLARTVKGTLSEVTLETTAAEVTSTGGLGRYRAEAVASHAADHNERGQIETDHAQPQSTTWRGNYRQSKSADSEDTPATTSGDTSQAASALWHRNAQVIS